MRLVTYNIQYSRGKDDRYDLERVVSSVADADLIALQEVERGWPRTEFIDQPARLGELLPDHYWVFAPTFDMHGGGQAHENRRRQFGPMLLCRRPIIWSRAHVLPKLASVDHFNMDTGALECAIETSVGVVRFFSLHLSALDSRERVLQTEFLLDLNAQAVACGAAWTGPPVSGGSADWSADAPRPETSRHAVLLGDFNSEPTDPVYDLLLGPRDHYAGRVPRVDSFVDVWARAHNDEQAEPTWYLPPGYPDSRDKRLDYGFVSAELASRVTDTWVDREALGSDHQPVWIEMEL